jgi:hypothetical protein
LKRDPANVFDRIATGIIIVCSVCVSIAWALTVPIFQNPDEPAHWQYAYDIYTVGRPIFAREGTATIADNADFLYLVRRTELNRIAFHPNEKVEPSYGSSEYFGEIDDDAPPMDRLAYQSEHTTPRLVREYPFGYYALAGLWMGIASFIHPGIVEAFFATRILSSLLFGATLVFLAAIMRRLRIEPITRLLVLAAVAFAPMVTMVSSAVQPDVLVGLLLTAATYSLLRYRETPTTHWAILVALILTFTSVVKLHYAMAGVIAAVIVISSRAHRIGAGTAIIHLGVLSVGVVVAQAFQYQITWQPQALYAAEKHGVWQTGPLVAAAHAGALSFVKDVLPETINTVYTLFVSGFVPQQFLGDYGWLDVPTHFPNQIQYAIVEAVEFTFNVALLLLGIVSTIVVFVRLLRIGQRCGWGQALVAFGDDPVLAIVLLYDAGMVALALFSPALGYQWRYWYPVYGLIAISIVRFVPRFLWYPLDRRFLSRTFAVLLFAWAMYGCKYGAVTIRERFFAADYGVTKVMGAANIRRSFVSVSQAYSRNT